ncbi:MAG TPA: hypothetical protein PKE47_03315 [Verrucomicrobiota bacterium]|nr:hypothetical protein [Verrucomicrobiota bacterium]
MLRKPQLLLLAAAALLPLVTLALPAGAQAGFRQSVGGLLQPLLGLLATAGTAAGNALPPAAAPGRFTALEQENERLRLALAERDAALRENERLRALAGLPRPAGWRLHGARIIGRDPPTGGARPGSTPAARRAWCRTPPGSAPRDSSAAW